MITVKGLSYRVADKSILQAISLTILPGEFIGLLGPSGCGKSTLLRIILGMVQPSDGVVQFMENGSPTTKRPNIGYVPQEDIVHRGLTVGKAFHYACRLHGGPELLALDVEKRTDEVLKKLELHHRRGTHIRSLSGGERKRVNVGIELLSEPDILFLDEPTAGLDPHLDRQLVKLFRSLADEKRTVLVTTHVLANIDQFESLIILAGGWLVFAGTLAAALEFFGVEEPEDIYSRVRRMPPPKLAERYLASTYAREYRSRRVESMTAPMVLSAEDVEKGSDPVEFPRSDRKQSPVDIQKNTAKKLTQVPDRQSDIESELAKLKERLRLQQDGKGESDIHG